MFFFIIKENMAAKVGSFTVRVGYQVYQHIRDILLIKSLKYFFLYVVDNNLPVRHTEAYVLLR